MSEEQAQSRLSQLRAIDPALLQEVVRQDQRSPDFEITDWSVDRLTDQGSINPDGLFIFRGQGRNGAGKRDWSVVLKILQRPDAEQDPRDVWYWKRELLLAQSGLLAEVNQPVIAPRNYRTEDCGTAGWVWMEYVPDESPKQWRLDEFAFAARQIGRGHAGYLTGAGLPDFPWLCEQKAMYLATGARPLHFLEDASVTRALGETLVRGVLQLWDQRERFFAALRQLPQVFSHGDAHRLNLCLRHASDGDELFGLDWAFCGRQAVGEEICSLVSYSAVLRAWSPDRVSDLETVAYPAYLAGLADGGWTGHPELVRLGYASATAMSVGAMMPYAICDFGKPELYDFILHKFGCTTSELVRGFVILEAYALECADEARRIMDRLGW